MKALDDILLFLWKMVLFTAWVVVFQSLMNYLGEPFTGEQAFHFIFAAWVIWQIEQIKIKVQDSDFGPKHKDGHAE